MRRILVAVPTLVILGALGAGCSGQAPTVQPDQYLNTVAPTESPTPPLDPALIAPCDEARRLILNSTGAFTGQLNTAVSAGERGDTAAQATAIKQLRATFTAWAGGLRELAKRTADPKLKAVLTEYAGGVDATIGRVKSVADLDKLYTFTDRELDLSANRFAQVCPAR